MTINKLQREIQKTLDALAATRPLLKGSISKVTLGKKARARGDRVAHLLTYKAEGNKTKSIYIKKHQLKEVKAMIQNYHKLKTTVNKLIMLNVMLFKASRL